MDARGTADAIWATARRELDGLPGGRGLNIAHEAVDRHAAGPRSERVALRFLGRDEPPLEVTYAALAEQTNRFANALAGLGVEAGDRVFALSARTPELYVAALGALKHRAVFCPLFSAFGPEPIHQRLERGGGVVLVTSAALYRRKVAEIRDRLPQLRHVLISGDEEAPEGTVSMAELLAAADPSYEIGPTDPEMPALLHFTSGTTGTPKGAVHVHQAVVAHHATAAVALGLRSDDVFWCTADPGWVTGTSYGIIAPLTHGATTVVDRMEFDARRWYGILASERVDVWYTAPTALRMLMRAGDELAAEADLSSVRVIASVGEPLTPDAFDWGRRVLHHDVLDNWWQTETGGIMVANVPGREARRGSMGTPLPGIEAAIVAVDDEQEPITGPSGGPVIVDEPDQAGMLALRRGWPSMFRAYLGEEERYRACFLGDWYLSGDLASRDADGWYHFVGRADDVVKTAGHLVGPFEVESVLMEHPAVAEAAVIGLPDPVAGDVLKAFVVLRPGVVADDAVRSDVLAHGRRRLGAIAPRSVEVVERLPHTRSGKVLRRLLRARELGLAEGDLSTLEAPVPEPAP